MGVSYVVLPLTKDVADWMDQAGEARPSPLEASRSPTLRELKAVVEGLEGYHSRVRASVRLRCVDLDVVAQGGYRAGWSTTIWAHCLHDKTRHPEDDDVIRFSFHKGSPELAVLVLERLSHVCGPFVLYCDGGGPGLAVTPGLEPRRAVEQWFSLLE